MLSSSINTRVCYSTWPLFLTRPIADKVPENPVFVYTLLRNRKKIEMLRAFTLESGQEEIERRNRRRKERSDTDHAGSLRSSVDSIRSQEPSQPQSPALSDVPEDSGAFAIGDDDDESDDEAQPTPTRSTASESTRRQTDGVSDFNDAVPTQLRGMSEKARGKMPAGMPTFSRQNSTTSLEGGRSSAAASQAGNGFEASPEWLESWLPDLPLHTILSTVQQLTAVLPRQAVAGEIATPEVLQRIQEVVPVGIDAPPPRVHTFEWSPMALGWYESLLWGFVFSAEVQPGKGTVGVWNGTGVKLFRVQGVGRAGPSLTSPRGAVDAVGRNVVERIGGMSLRGQGSGQGQGQQQQQQ